MEQFSFDLGGFIGGVLGAIAAGAGVFYSLRKTSQFEKEREAAKFRALRTSIITEARVSATNLFYLEETLKSKPDRVSVSATFTWWVETRAQLFNFTPSVIRANLSSISLFEEQEIDVILMVQGAMTDFSEALEDARSCSREDEFANIFEAMQIRKWHLIYQLRLFFLRMAPDATLKLLAPDPTKNNITVVAALAQMSGPPPLSLVTSALARISVNL